VLLVSTGRKTNSGSSFHAGNISADIITYGTEEGKRLTEIEKLLSGVALPPAAAVAQTFDKTELTDPETYLRLLLETENFYVKPGARIAITCGSRGIDQYGNL
jgi:hypothetical protein